MFPLKMVIFHSKLLVYQRVDDYFKITQKIGHLRLGWAEDSCD